MQRFNVVIPRSDGGVEVTPMKEWLRDHPEHVPAGLDPTRSTSHQLRSGLRKQGWEVQDSPTEVRLLMPGVDQRGGQIETVLGSTGDNERLEDEPASFDLEAQLRDFVVANLGRIPVGGRRVSLYTSPGGRSGVEHPTDVGPIDILAVDESGDFVVFELKIERGPDRTLGQLARYMGWVKQHLAHGRPVTGVIVARSIDEKLRYAATVIPSVLLLEYELEFKLNDACLAIQPTGL